MKANLDVGDLFYVKEGLWSGYDFPFGPLMIQSVNGEVATCVWFEGKQKKQKQLRLTELVKDKASYRKLKTDCPF